jgi:hypothetical protein
MQNKTKKKSLKNITFKTKLRLLNQVYIKKKRPKKSSKNIAKPSLFVLLVITDYYIKHLLSYSCWSCDAAAIYNLH